MNIQLQVKICLMKVETVPNADNCSLHGVD